MLAASAQPFYQRAQEFSLEQQQRAAKLGLSRKELKKRYPTPEVHLAKAVKAMPGETVQIDARGRIVEGSLIGFTCPDLEVLSIRSGAAGLHARVKVPRQPQQRACFLEVISPVSMLGITVRALEIEATYEWRLRLSNGIQVDATYVGGFESRPVKTVIRLPDGTEVARRIALGESPPGPERIGFEWTQEDTEAIAAKWTASPEKAELDALWTELARMRKANTPEGEMKALLARKLPPLEAKRMELHKTHPVLCDELVFDVSENGAVKGKAYGCAIGGTVDVTGQVRMVKG
jgi:hypothetical protein